MTPKTMSRLLRTIDPLQMRQHSVIDYRIPGMNCLCLHHTPDLIVKIYMLEDVGRYADRFLGPPHTSRRAFAAHLMNGVIDVFTYDLEPGGNWQENHYDTRRRSTIPLRRVQLDGGSQVYGYLSDVWIDTKTVHTLKVRPECGPLVVGVTLLRTERDDVMFYDDGTKYEPSHPRRPTMDEMFDMIDKANFYSDHHLNVRTPPTAEQVAKNSLSRSSFIRENDLTDHRFHH